MVGVLSSAQVRVNVVKWQNNDGLALQCTFADEVVCDVLECEGSFIGE